MKLSHIKGLKYQIFIPFLIFILGIAALSGMTYLTYVSSEQEARTLTKLNAVSYGDQMIRYITEGITVTDSLEQIVVSEDGKVNKFNRIAADMMTDYIQSIQLAPDGVVTQIYPLAGNEAGLIDLFHDETRAELACYARDHHMTIAQGPFPMKQGGTGIAIRNPVYLTDSQGNETFWGFTIIILRTPDVFANSLRSLTDFGYAYRLSKTPSPLSLEYELVDSSGQVLDDPVIYTFQLGGCVWKMEVMPIDGWNNSQNAVIIFSVGLVIILLLTGLSVALLIINNRRRILKQLSITDSLTGLLNRHGFETAVAKYTHAHPQEPCVGITFDIDDFKFINDMYGHATGDYALQQLAANMKTTFSDHGFLARNGGDEFSVFLTNCTREQASALLEQFMLLPRHFNYEDEQLSFNISLGYAVYPTQAATASDLFHKADSALYEVKLRGKNNCLAYESDFVSEKRSQLGFALKDVSEHLPAAFLIYKADPDDDRILFANYELIQLAGCDNLDGLLRHSNDRFRNLIAPDERDDTEAAIFGQLRSGKYGTDTHIEFPLLRKDGTQVSVFSHGRIVDNNYYGTIFYVLITDADALKGHYSL